MYVQFGFVVNLLLVRGIEIVESGVKKKLTSITHFFFVRSPSFVPNSLNAWKRILI